MPDPEPSQEQVVEAIYGFAAQQLHDGVAPAEVEKRLVEHGLSAEAAASVVDNLKQARAQAAKEAGKKNMIYGALWCVGGIVVTALTFTAAENGGRYVITWGAILFGGIQFVRGMIQSSDADRGQRPVL